jgi:hypothetical protein
MEKYKELFNLSKEILNEELNRYRSLEEKASKYISALTVLIGIYAFFVSQLFPRLFPPQEILDWLLGAILFLLFISIITSWFFIFKILRVSYLSKTPLTIEFFDEHRLVDIYYAIARTNHKALIENRKTNDYKSKLLGQGYQAMRITMILTIIFFFMFAFYACKNTKDKYIKNDSSELTRVNQGVVFMENKNENPVPQEVTEPPEIEPDPDVKPPEPDIVTEGCDEPITKREGQ